jgi:hypothetical protein
MMTIELPPAASATPPRAAPGRTPAVSRAPVVPRCESATSEADCPYCSGPESD